MEEKHFGLGGEKTKTPNSCVVRRLVKHEFGRK